MGSFSAMPVFMIAGERGEGVPLDPGQMDFSGPLHVGEASAYTTEPMQRQLAAVDVGPIGARLGLGMPDRSLDDTEGFRSRMTFLRSGWTDLSQSTRSCAPAMRARNSQQTPNACTLLTNNDRCLFDILDLVSSVVACRSE